MSDTTHGATCDICGKFAVCESTLNDVANQRDTLQADLTHIRRWVARQLVGLEREVVTTVMEGALGWESAVSGLAGQSVAFKNLLAEMSRLEKA